MLETHGPQVAEAFGLGRARALEGPVAFGRQGAVWRLETERGRYAVKVGDRAPDPAQAELDASWQEAFLAAGVPMPAVVRTREGAVVADVGGTLVRVHTWVDVRDEDRRLDPSAVGRLLAACHALRLDGGDRADPWFVDPVGADAWGALVSRLQAAGAPWADRLAALVPGLVAAEAVLAPPRDLQVCHRDLWADNLRDSPAGLVALDWENAGPADPSQELAQVVLEFACGEPARAQALVTAYEEAGGPGRLRTLGDFSMLLAVQGHLVQEGCRRWLAAGNDAERADNAGWVAEFLDEPWLVPQVEHMLTWVAP